MATTLAPLPTLAQDASLAPGTVATNTAGETLLVRSTPGWDGAAAGEVASGAQVTVGDYPVTAADGSLWYPVAGGYVPASGLSTGATADPSGVTDQASGYYDEYGNWVDTTTAQAAPAPQASGYLDQNGNWVDTSGQNAPAESGTSYYDEAGNWIDTTATAATTQPAPVDGSSGYDDQTGAWVDTSGQNPNAATGSVVYNDASGASNTNNIAAAAAPIGTAYIAGTNGDGAICRSAADWSSAELGVVPEGSAVEVTGGTVGEWQPVNCNGVSGYVHASFVSWDAPVTADTTLTATGDTSVSETPSGYRNNRNNRRGNNNNTGDNRGGSGQEIVNFAMQYQGYPYVYAGSGPSGFDCSGFTNYVVQNTLGMNIGGGVEGQYSYGTPVSRNQLQPGDLVFFANTFRPGLSHVGIYIGGGQFIHSENESTGVVISDLNSDYYSSHYYGAVRLA